MEIYVVQPNDTVDSIAMAAGVDLTSLIYTNQLVYPYRLAVGQALFLLRREAGESGDERSAEGGGKGIASDERFAESAGERIAGDGRSGESDEEGESSSSVSGLPSMRRDARKYGGDPSSSPSPLATAFGYAYPFISRWVLAETLPYMRQLAVFSYGFTRDGELIPPTLEDKWIVEEALANGVKPVVTLTPLGADGYFNNNLVTALVNDDNAQLRLLRSLVGVMAEKGYAGVNIDFEYVPAEDRDAFTDFVGRAAGLLNQFEYEVSVALAPKTSDTQQGLLYEGMDYAGLGAAANWVLLMTYEWGYTLYLTGQW